MKLDYQTRKLLKIILDDIARQKNAYSLEEMENAALKANVNQRQAFAGGYGQAPEKRSKKKVHHSIDYKPRVVLNPVVQCGYAIGSDMTKEERESVFNIVRKNPIKSTVRIIHADGTQEIKLVWDMQPQTEAEEKAAPKAKAAVKAPVIPDVVKYQHIVGNIGNVE